jgi:hypothetical protein
MPKQHANTSGNPIESLFQGSVVDENGNETMITKQMIQKACEDLEEEAISICRNESFNDHSFDDETFND